ncbi:glycoside hydrolase family 3 protein [Xylariomycetidae sp. FL0641]|nr:glycoside hydrolase family 3 protein [Xylariomycetidae sp. FL0641]
MLIRHLVIALGLSHKMNRLAFFAAALAFFQDALCVVLPGNASSASPREQARKLLEQMTWAEKVGQLGGVRRILDADMTFNRTNYDSFIQNYQNGQIGFGSMFNSPGDVLPFANQLRQEQIDSSRLHVPFITVTDSINGLLVTGGTTFPGNLAVSSSFNVPLFKQAVAAIRDEQVAMGVRWILSPELDVAVDPRYGRVGETFGEDTYLIGEFGLGYVQTMQEKDEDGFMKVACTIKHFIYGETRGGVNTASMYGGINHIFNDKLPPYIKIISEGNPASLMVSYSTVDLIPMSKNEYMLQDILRQKLGFDGLIMSDAFSVSNMYTQSKTAKTLEDAALQAMAAGVGMELSPGTAGTYPSLLSHVNNTAIADLINQSALRMLEIKFATGTFDEPLPTLENLQATLRAPAHLAINRAISRESIVLLQNQDLLPATPRKVALLGPFADIINAGSYAAVNASAPQHGNTLRGSLTAALGDDAVIYVQGCDFLATDAASNAIAAAVAAAKDAGFAIVAVGSLSVSTETPLAAKRTDGEFAAHADLGFPGLQQQLLDAVLDAGVPTVVVLSGGQVFALPEPTTRRAGAILHTFLAGEGTADAAVAVLLGAVNPSGKLPVSMPQASGATPVAYDYLPSDDQGGSPSLSGGRDRRAADWQFPVLTRAVPFPFGFGLSYTSFAFGAAGAVAGDGEVTVAVTVRNTGDRAGKEVVQVYYRPAYTPDIEFPVKKLVRFDKILLGPGQSREVAFTIPTRDLGYWVNTKFKVLSGDYQFWVGSSSRDEDLIALNATLTV